MARVRISWNRNQVKELKQEIKRYNREVEKLWRKFPDSETRPQLPPTLDYDTVRNRVYTNEDLRNEINSLKRIRKPGAGKVDANGVLHYINNEYNIARSTYNRAASQRLKTIEKEAENIKPAYRKAWIAGGRQGNDTEKFPKIAKPVYGDIETIKRRMRGNASYESLDKYIRMLWENIGINDELLKYSNEIMEIYERFIREKPNAITIIIARGYEELFPDWFYHFRDEFVPREHRYARTLRRWRKLQDEFFND